MKSRVCPARGSADSESNLNSFPVGGAATFLSSAGVSAENRSVTGPKSWSTITEGALQNVLAGARDRRTLPTQARPSSSFPTVLILILLEEILTGNDS